MPYVLIKNLLTYLLSYDFLLVFSSDLGSSYPLSSNEPFGRIIIPRITKNNSTVNILWRIFHILTEPVPYTFVSENRRNNEALTHTTTWARDRYSVDTNVYGTGSVRMWKTRHRIAVDIFYSEKRRQVIRRATSATKRGWKGLHSGIPAMSELSAETRSSSLRNAFTRANRQPVGNPTELAR